MRKLVCFSILSAFLLLVSNDVSAQRKVRVRFPRGASAVTVRGTITRYEARDYIVRAAAGQTLDLRVTGTNELTVFTVLLPNGRNLEAASDIDEYTGELPVNGDYVIRVDMMRAAARVKGSISSYKLRISIK